MRVLLTGATGFIGRALALRLLRDHHTVTAWVRDPAKARQTLGAEVALLPATADDAPLDAAVAAADVIIHLAGEPVIAKRWTDAQKKVLLASRVELGERLSRAVSRAATKPAALVSASAIGYYGDRGDEPLTEDSPPGTDFLAELCVAWERSTAAVETAGLRRVVLRIGIVLGPEGGALAKMLTPFKLGVGGRIGSGRQWMSWVHLEDVLEMIVRAATDARYQGAINAVSPKPVTNTDFTAALGRALHRPAVLPVPSLALKALFGEGASAIVGSQKVLPRALETLGFTFAHPRVDEALADVVGPGSAGRVSVSVAGSSPENAYTSRRKPRYLLQQVTHIDAPLDEVFAFFSQAENLGAITPPALAFAIQTPLPIAMGAGTTIDYRITLGPVPMPWRTVIHDWEDGARFADAQEKGPYAAWWHEHHFAADGAGTRMEDRVYYAPPLGPLGTVANALFIERTLQRIFGYRAFAIRLRFG